MKSALQKYTASFWYGQKEVPFHFWLHTDNKDVPIDTVVFLGSGQQGRITKWVAANTPSGTVVVEGLPHKIADRSAHDLREFAHNYTDAALLAVLKTLNLTSAYIVAESQAAPGAVWTALDNLPQVKGMVLIAPLGLTAHILGASPKERLKELKKRAFMSSAQFAQSPLYDWRNFYLNALMLHAVLLDTRWKASGQKYAVGASHDLREDCRELAVRLHQKGGTFTLIHYLDIITLKTSHTSLAIRDGKEILHKAVMIARQRG